jgi:parallel beta-helix repeat protein
MSRSSLAMLALAVGCCAALGASQASADHVGCGDVITADTTLDGDLLDCPNNGLVIGADDITLDLNGHRIDGDGTEFAGCGKDEFCDVGVLNRGHDGITVRDGSVRQFAVGVFVLRARDNRLRKLATVEDMFNGILLIRSAHGLIHRSTASRNGRTTDFPGLAMFESHDNRITHNTLSRNGDLPLILEGSNRNRLAHNKARGNPEGGMIIEGNRNEIVRNRLVRNGGGLLITIVSRGGEAVGNVIRRNVVRNPRVDGISVDEVPKRTVISRNLVVGAGRDGISVLSPATRLTRNRAVRNGHLGIKAVEGVTDGGGNRASGNGDPRQCLNVKCR